MALQAASVVLVIALLALSPGGLRGAELDRRIAELTSSRTAVLAGGLLSSFTFAAAALLAAAVSREGLTRGLRLGRGRAGAARIAALAAGMMALGQAVDSAVALLGWGGQGTLGLLSRAMEGVSGPMLAVSVLVLGVMAGGGEELFFRGYLQTQLRRRMRPWAAVAVAAAAFGLVHLDPLHSPIALMMGLVLGWITEASGSVRPAVAVHILNNTVWVLMVAFLPLSWPTEVHAAALAASLPAGVALLALGSRRLA